MARPHLLVQHLLKQLEQHAADRAHRDPRPEWLATVIERAAECFVPLQDVARVGYECELTEGGWEARLYLGTMEIVGGREDGHSRRPSFELDLAGLTHCFSQVDELRWNVAGSETGGSFVTVRGSVREERPRPQSLLAVPQHAGPALRAYPDGQIRPVPGV